MIRTLIFVFVLKQCGSEYLIISNQPSLANALRKGPGNVGSRIVGVDSFDWRLRKMVSPVKNQRTCRASWAFSLVGNIESHLSIHENLKVNLSEQFLIDCDREQHACFNGSLYSAFVNVVTKFKGVLRSKEYYEFNEHRNACRWRGSPKPVPVLGFTRVPSDENVMKKALKKYGPLSATLNSQMMRDHEANTIDTPLAHQCNPKRRDYAVLIVGYNSYYAPEGTWVEYWIIKNSKGIKWGDKGYYYLVLGKNACGIAEEVYFVTTTI